MKRLSQLLGAASLMTGLVGCDGEPAFDESCDLLFGNGQQITVPVAKSHEQVMWGLQERGDPAPGMLFVWGEPATRYLWMKNTPAPLSAAWIDVEGTVIAILDLHPYSLEKRGVEELSVAALEVPAGYFEQAGISKGSRIRKAECIPNLKGDDIATEVDARDVVRAEPR